MNSMKTLVSAALLSLTLEAGAEEATPTEQQVERDRILSLAALAVVYRDWQKAPVTPASRGHNIGSILVDNDSKPVFWARNAANKTDNASQHGEVRLIQNFLNCPSVGKYAKGYTVYTTLEPCAMCTGLMTLTRVSRVVYVQADPGFGHARDALKKINYPNVFDQYSPSDLDQKKALEAGFQNYSQGENNPSITDFLLTVEARNAFSTAEKQLSDYKTTYPENASIVASAQAFVNQVPGVEGDDHLPDYCPTK